VSASQTANIAQQLEEILTDQVGSIGRSLERRTVDALKPLNSFREVDEGIDFGSADSATLVGQLVSGSAEDL